MKTIQARNKLIVLKKLVTAENIKSLVMGKPIEAEKMIMDVFRDHNNKMKELLGRPDM